MTNIRLLLALLLVLAPAAAWPQAAPSLSSVRVLYNTRTATVNPQGELKARIDALDAEIADAMRFGRSAEARRLYAKGTTLLAGQPWTAELDYATSLPSATESRARQFSATCGDARSRGVLDKNRLGIIRLGGDASPRFAPRLAAR